MRTLIVNPVMCEVGKCTRARGFVKIEYSDDGRLSLSGVIGPTSGGNARGSCGQIIEEIRDGECVDGWTLPMKNKLCRIWDEWHMNDMRPYCEHQKELGWDKLAGKNVNLYNWKLNEETLREQKDAKDAAIYALKAGQTFTPNERQTFVASLEWHIKTTTDYLPDELSKFYKASDSCITPHIKTKSLGWFYPSEHPDGLLTKPCPVCGYKYGTEWKREEVPQEVIEWLFSLPETKVKPAWI